MSSVGGMCAAKYADVRTNVGTYGNDGSCGGGVGMSVLCPL